MLWLKESIPWDKEESEINFEEIFSELALLALFSHHQLFGLFAFIAAPPLFGLLHKTAKYKTAACPAKGKHFATVAGNI